MIPTSALFVKSWKLGIVIAGTVDFVNKSAVNGVE